MRWLNPEIALGALLATILWAGALGWQAAYAPTEKEKQECHETAKKTGRKTEECKNIWERTTSDPVALFTFILAGSTIGLWVATVGLYLAGKQTIKETRRIGEAQVRAYVSIKSATIAFMGPRQHPVVGFVATNTGQSPARNFVWNVVVQYAGRQYKTQSFYEPWRTRMGIDIPAVSDAPFEQAIVPHISLTDFVESLENRGRGAVVRIKVEFRSTDVFGIDLFGEAYFHGLGPQQPPPEDPTAISQPYVLNATARPTDWDGPI